jgi:hypothetical protein
MARSSVSNVLDDDDDDGERDATEGASIHGPLRVGNLAGPGRIDDTAGSAMGSPSPGLCLEARPVAVTVG